ncbi:hypothetical protein KCP74_02340 [Salmonella enterica subsp. enterica]|nr:hypothetical protein KCP74_02340 [Salmonella enterica subsp. enterica]
MFRMWVQPDAAWRAGEIDKVAALADWIELNLRRYCSAAGRLSRWRLALYSACQSGRINATPCRTSRYLLKST